MPKLNHPAPKNHPWRNGKVALAKIAKASGKSIGKKSICPFCEVPDDIPHADDCPIK